jgi:diguanylate cyclase
MADREELLVFADEKGAPVDSRTEGLDHRRWKVLVVDDDRDVHEATEFALRDCRVLGRPLAFLHAFSGAESLRILGEEDDVAAILLDAVMETDDAGLRTVRAIRDDLGLREARIIMRTGQPGHVPELDTITRYDINDYKTKSELTRDKLLITLITAIRSYDQLRRIETSRRGLEKIVEASNQFIAEKGLQSFAEGVITQIASLIGVDPDGMVCACEAGKGALGRRYSIIAAAGRFRGLILGDLKDMGDREIADCIERCFDKRLSLLEEQSLTIYFEDSGGKGYAAWIGSDKPLLDVDGHLIEVFCSNIGLCADNIELVSRLQRQAYEDSLVGLPNLSAFIEDVDRIVESGSGEGKAIALVDLAQFGALNDMLGHRYGDRLLKAVASRLKEGLPESCVVARAGTDVFGILGDAGLVSGGSIGDLLSRSLEVDGMGQNVSASIGFAALDGSSRVGSDYLKNAHIALKRAKSEGIGQAVWYSEDIGIESRERARLLQSLQRDFEGNRLFLVYQPQVELSGGRPVGLEALMRWKTDDGRLVSPERFIPVAEFSGLIRPMGIWALRTALLDLRRLKRSGRRALRMAVNVSAVQLRDPLFLSELSRAMADFEVGPNELEIEITESISLSGIVSVMKTLGEIKSRGITIAVDDFGTGYSSLSSIDSWPIDRIKIDRSFVTGIDREDARSRIVDLVIPLGRRLSVGVLAEGVESEAQAGRLRQLGCLEAQGFLYARPMPFEEVSTWLARG